MSPSAISIYSGMTNSGQLTETSTFSDVDFLIITTPNLPSDEGYEIAASIVILSQVLVPIGAENILVDLGEKELAIDLNFIDTGSVIFIPDEYTRSHAQMKLILASSYSVELEIYAVQYQGCELAVEPFQETFQEALNSTLTPTLQTVLPDILMTFTSIPSNFLFSIGGAEEIDRLVFGPSNTEITFNQP